jgi:hypothetical protein
VWQAQAHRRIHPADVYEMPTPCGYVLSPGDAFTIYNFLLDRSPTFAPVCLYTFKGNYLISGTNVPPDCDPRRPLVLINGRTGSVWESGVDGRTNWYGVGFTTMSFDAIKTNFPVGSDMRTVFNTLGTTRSSFAESKSSYPYFSHNLMSITFELVPETWTIKEVRTSQWGFR